jgi:DNA-binding FadR family transcriptional regulator
MHLKLLESDFLNYILSRGLKPGDALPSLQELSKELGVNVGKLREQLEVARSLGLVEVRPRTGIRVRKLDFLPAIRLSLLFGIAMNRGLFESFSDMRNAIEVAFLPEAARRLTEPDITELRRLIAVAFSKLSSTPWITIPHQEHRAFHMTIFTRLNNPFVIALLDAYWEAYEAVELNTYAHLDYWQEAWTYHQRILDFICKGDYEAAQVAFIEHTRLLRHRDDTNHPPTSTLPAPGEPTLAILKLTQKELAQKAVSHDSHTHNSDS